MQYEPTMPDGVAITRLKEEWLELEKELFRRFEGLGEHFRLAESGKADPDDVASAMRSEIDACLDRLNRIKEEMTKLRLAP